MNRPIYNRTPFGLSEAGNDPFPLFDRWFSDAQRADPNDAAVAGLATATLTGRPSLRMVLLKESGPGGFVFFTGYESRKAADLLENPLAAMTFWWPSQERQVRLEGPVGKISAAESDAYFETRPRESRLSAWASPQSRVIAQPVTLDAAAARFADQPVPRPPGWGGYRLHPDHFEFWQGRENRLHDRIRFTRKGPLWEKERLAP